MATARMPSNCGSDLLNATPGKSGTAPQAGSGQRGGLHPFTRPVVQILAQERHLLGTAGALDHRTAELHLPTRRRRRIGHSRGPMLRARSFPRTRTVVELVAS